MNADDYDRLDALMADHPWVTGECPACAGDGKDHGLQEPERSMNPCPLCSKPAHPLERLNTPDVRAVLDGEGPAPAPTSQEGT